MLGTMETINHSSTEALKAQQFKSLPIVSRHNSLFSAVMASGLDLSYNEQAALESIARLDRGSRHAKPVTEAFVVKNGDATEVWYKYECDIKLVNKFEPFFGALHNGPFYPCLVVDTTIEIMVSRPMSSCPENRKAFAKHGLQVTKP
jgi:hypothetical protein